jgi:hypothetical protein
VRRSRRPGTEPPHRAVRRSVQGGARQQTPEELHELDARDKQTAGRSRRQVFQRPIFLSQRADTGTIIANTGTSHERSVRCDENPTEDSDSGTFGTRKRERVATVVHDGIDPATTETNVISPDATSTDSSTTDTSTGTTSSTTDLAYDHQENGGYACRIRSVGPTPDPHP